MAVAEQIHREGGALAHLGFHADVSPLPGDDAVGQIQPQADSLLGRHLRGAVEPLEHVVVVLLRDADAGVGDVDAGVELPGPHQDGHAAALRRVFHCVVQKVAQSLRRPFGVVLDGDGAVTVGGELDALFLRPGPHRAHGLGNGVAEAGVLHVQGKGPRLQPGHFDEGLQEKIQLVQLPGHGAQELLPLLLAQGVLAQDAGEHLEIGDGGLDLVGDIADQTLEGLLVPLALALALAHNVEVLHQLALDLGGEAVLIGLVPLDGTAGQQRVQSLAQIVGKEGDLPPLVPGPQPHCGVECGAEAQNGPAHRGPGDGGPQQPYQGEKQRRREQKHPGAHDRQCAVLHGLPPVQT